MVNKKILIMTKDLISISVNIKYKTLIIGVLTTLLSVIAYLYFMPLNSPSFELNDKLNTSFQIFGIGIALTTLIYGAFNLHFLLTSQNDSNVQQIKRYTSDIMRIWSTKEMFEFASIARKTWYERGSKSDEQYVKEILDNETVYIAITSILNFFEHVAQLVEVNIVDDKMIKNYYYSVVRDYKDRYFPLIQYLRKEAKTDLVLIDFEQMAIRWDNENYKTPHNKS